MPLISIIIPTFNCEKHIARCLKSIIQQTFIDYEILIIDGESTDKTIKIIENFEDPRVIIYSGQDKGIYDAMNKGVKLAKGNWLYFIGSDDMLLNKDSIYEISTFLQNPKYDVFYGDVISERFDGIYAGEFSNEKLYVQNICHQAIFFNKSVFKEIGLFCLKFAAHADWAHNIKWFLNRKIKKKYINQVIAEYADGGFSSINGDLIFAKKKDWYFFRYSLLSQDLIKLLILSKQILDNKKDLTLYELLYVYLMRLLLKLKHKFLKQSVYA